MLLRLCIFEICDQNLVLLATDFKRFFFAKLQTYVEEHSWTINEKKIEKNDFNIRLFGVHFTKYRQFSFAKIVNFLIDSGLQEASLMGKVIGDSGQFELWLREFLPQLFDENFELAPGEVIDR